MPNRVLFVPWKQVESIKHYASRRGVPTKVDKFGNLVFDPKLTRGHAPWTQLMQPLSDYGVLNPVRYPDEGVHDFAARKTRMEHEAASGNFPGHEYVSKNREWKKAEAAKNNGKDWYEVWYTGRVSPIIMSLNANDQIYIRGHGLPGDTEIQSSAWKLDADEVARRLIASGLQKNFAGKIKCYNCHSAESGIDKAFAQAFADRLYSSGYKSCEYFGYFGALDSFPGANDVKPEMEKGKLQNPHTLHKTSLYEDQLSRASSKRLKITPKKI